MDALIDFEKLIDLNVSLLSERSSQEPIDDVLDKMCEAIDESNLAVNNILKNNGFRTSGEILDYEIVNLDDFLPDISLRLEEDDLETNNNMFNCDSRELCETASNNDVIDLDEFEIISENLFEYTEDGKDNIIESNLQKIISTVAHYEVPVEFEDNLKINSVKPIADDINKLKTENNSVKFENGSETATERNDKIETNIIIENTLNLKNNNNEVKCNNRNEEYIKRYVNSKESRSTITVEIGTSLNNYDEAKYKFEPKFKDTLQITEELNEHINSDSDDGFDPADFEFISEHEASKAGIITKMSNTTINEAFVPENAENSKTNKENQFLNQNIQLNNHCAPSTSKIDDKHRKNEASLSDYIKYNKYRYQRCHSLQSCPTSSPHVIPEGEQYLDMFRGQYAPEVVNNLYNVKNKKTLSAVAMAVSIEELAYRDPGEDEEYEKYKEEVDDCLKKILSMYPQENARKRRRC